MKARELIEKLQAIDPETEVVAMDCAYCQGQFEPAVAELYDFGLGDGEVLTIEGRIR